MRYLLHLRILSIEEERRKGFVFDDHIEQAADYDDMLVVDVLVDEDSGTLKAWAKWASEIRTPLRDYEPEGDPLTDQDPVEGQWRTTVRLASPMGDFLGNRAVVQLTVRGRRSADDPSYRP